ncbi:MAG TPA: NTP transferase domain-containing protein [Candidatus Limiplasma sp.]|nr:NTP transferase domain-containing protein [Candidatus Limiplasma sp.]
MFISKVGGLIAAASQKATRPTLQLGGISVVKRIVLTMQQAGVFPIVVVTGVEADEVRYQLAGRGMVFLYNRDFSEPELLDSVRMGLNFLQGRCERVVFTPVNVPLFSQATLRALLAAEGEIVTPSYRKQGGHPIVLDNRVIPDILAYRGRQGLRGAIAGLEKRRRWVEVEDEGVLLTIHQEAALQKHLQAHASDFLHPNLRLSLEGEEELLSARAKLLLLLIGETHSVREASERMALSPSKAWNVINKLEAALGYPVLSRRQGGQQGSGSDLTPEGFAFLVAFQRYEEQVIAFSNARFEAMRNAGELVFQPEKNSVDYLEAANDAAPKGE